jgi:hypothetical protein
LAHSLNQQVTYPLDMNCFNELTLPRYGNHSTQIIGNFLKDLDLYFTLNAVPENLKLPLAARGGARPNI